MPPEHKKRGGMGRRNTVEINQKEPSNDDNHVPKRLHDATSAKRLRAPVRNFTSLYQFASTSGAWATFFVIILSSFQPFISFPLFFFPTIIRLYVIGPS